MSDHRNETETTAFEEIREVAEDLGSTAAEMHWMQKSGLFLIATAAGILVAASLLLNATARPLGAAAAVVPGLVGIVMIIAGSFRRQ